MKRLLCLLLFTPVILFGAKPPDWLSLPAPADPRPVNASAWVLFDSTQVQQTDPGVVMHRYRHAVMPLSEAGVEGTRCIQEFSTAGEKLEFARAWAMSPDGRQCREFGTDEFVIYSPTISNLMWDQTKVATFFPKKYLQPGWIFAWEIEIKCQSSVFDSEWTPRSILPTRLTRFEVIPLPGGSVKWHAFSPGLPNPTAGNEPGALQWTMTDLPGSDREIPSDLETEEADLRATLFDPQTKEAAPQDWSDMVRLARLEMDPQAVATPAIQTQAHSLAGTGGLWSRIEPVCRFVQKNISYLEVSIASDTMAGYRPHPADEVCTNRFGDCKDKAVLLCTMLGSLGVDARVMLINYNAPRRNQLEWPSASFNHAIVALKCTEPAPAGATVVRAGGTDYLLFDPTDDRVPLGLLPAGDTGGLGLILADGVTAPVEIPLHPITGEQDQTDIEIELAGNGTAKITTTEERSLLAAALAGSRDETVSRDDRTSALEQRIQRSLPLASDLTWDSSSDSAHQHWTRKTSFTAQYTGKRLPGGMYVDTDLLSVVPDFAPWDAQTPGWFLSSPQTATRVIHLHAPAGWEFSEVPGDWAVHEAAGDGSMSYHQEGALLTGEIKLHLTGGVLDRGAYLDLRHLLQAAAAAEHRPVFLHHRPAAVPATAPSAASAKPQT